MEINSVGQFSCIYAEKEDLDEDEDNARVLIAQSEPEILILIRRFLKVKGVGIVSATRGIKKFNKFQKVTIQTNPLI